MDRILACTAITAVALMVGGCSSGNFMVYKNGRSFFVTDDSYELKLVLCDSGDIDSIVKDSELPDSLQKELKDGICASDKSKTALMNTLGKMSNEQRNALKDSFNRNGYEINKVADACGGG